MLNAALHTDQIPGFNRNINSNFNHCMYADDLVLITRATRFAARNIKLCLNFYGHLTGQHLNVSKSSIYFPSWFNKRVQASICSILCIDPTSLPFKYLGVLISLKKLDVSVFNHLIEKIRHSCTR